MNNEAREREPDPWPGDESTAAEVLEDGEITEDPSFVREPPIDIRGAWRKAHHYHCWWVVGHYLMYPCHSEREAGRVLRKLQADWDET